MKYSIKPKNDSDKENAKQLELIMNHKLATYDDIDDIELAKMREPSFSINRNPFYPRSYASKDTVEIINAILFQKQKQPKENHPYGWYRKFEKKRF